MKMSGSNTAAFVLIGVGALILLDKIGAGLGSLMHYLVPLAMIYFGYMAMTRGRTGLGLVLLVLGFIVLMGQFTGLFGLLIAVGMIIFGYSMLKKNPSTHS